MREEASRIVDMCKDFVRAMNRVEGALASIGTTLTATEREEVVHSVLSFIDSPEITGSYTREIARELIAQLSAAGMYADYKGSTDSYIQ